MRSSMDASKSARRNQNELRWCGTLSPSCNWRASNRRRPVASITQRAVCARTFPSLPRTVTPYRAPEPISTRTALPSTCSTPLSRFSCRNASSRREPVYEKRRQRRIGGDGVHDIAGVRRRRKIQLVVEREPILGKLFLDQMPSKADFLEQLRAELDQRFAHDRQGPSRRPYDADVLSGHVTPEPGSREVAHDAVAHDQHVTIHSGHPTLLEQVCRLPHRNPRESVASVMLDESQRRQVYDLAGEKGANTQVFTMSEK